jgi:hypothetical protein
MGKRDGYGSQQGGWKKEGLNGSGSASAVCGKAPISTPHRRRQCGAQPINVRLKLQLREDRPLKYTRPRCE